MVKIDLHTHTNRYSECSHLSPSELVRLSRLRGLDGIVVTEHDRQWSSGEIDELRGISGELAVYGGFEASLPEGHFLVIGMEHEGAFDTGISLRELSALAEEEDAALIWAHPGRFGGKTVEPGLIHGIEVMSFNIGVKQVPLIRGNQEALRIPPVAASDSHRPVSIGTYATLFPHLPSDEKELARMIRKSMGIPWADEERITAVNSSIGSAEDRYLTASPV